MPDAVALISADELAPADPGASLGVRVTADVVHFLQARDHY
jgi:hypothetical protein